MSAWINIPMLMVVLNGPFRRRYLLEHGKIIDNNSVALIQCDSLHPLPSHFAQNGCVYVCFHQQPEYFVKCQLISCPEQLMGSLMMCSFHLIFLGISVSQAHCFDILLQKRRLGETQFHRDCHHISYDFGIGTYLDSVKIHQSVKQVQIHLSKQVQISQLTRLDRAHMHRVSLI